MKNLKNSLEILAKDVEKKEAEFRMKNIFQGAGMIRVAVKKSEGKALGLKQEYVYGSEKRYIIHSINTNGALQYAEDEVSKIIRSFEQQGMFAIAHTTLL